MPSPRPSARRELAAATLAGACALTALLLVSGCGDKGRREQNNPFIGPSGAETSQPFAVLPVQQGDGRVARR
ncbi:MAG: hypothetical protein H0X38_03350 [Planctomycetes bacterium]|nr:hypothetical protein [Planctomycetota bacterium]